MILTTSYGMKCDKCSFRNKPYASRCKQCDTSLVNAYDTQIKERSHFIDDIDTGDYSACKKYLETQDPAALPTSINHIHCGLGTPIHTACVANNTAIIKLLLKYKADPNIVVPFSSCTE